MENAPGFSVFNTLKIILNLDIQQESMNTGFRVTLQDHTMCPGSSYPLYIVS